VRVGNKIYNNNKIIDALTAPNIYEQETSQALVDCLVKMTVTVMMMTMMVVMVVVMMGEGLVMDSQLSRIYCGKWNILR